MADDDEEQEEEWFCKFCMEQKLPRKKLCTEDDIIQHLWYIELQWNNSGHPPE